MSLGPKQYSDNKLPGRYIYKVYYRRYGEVISTYCGEAYKIKAKANSGKR
jgi:hypothetical protein